MIVDFDSINFGNRLKTVRLEKGFLTQQKFAEALGLGRATVINYESGKNKPNIEVLYNIANTLDCTFDYLFGIDKYPSKKDEYIWRRFGLTPEATKVLTQIAALRYSTFAGRSDILDTINRLLETMNFLIFETGYTEHTAHKNTTGAVTVKSTGRIYSDGLINRINDYLRFTSESVDIEAINRMQGKDIVLPYTLDEETLANLLLAEITKELVKLRKTVQKEAKEKNNA